MSNMHHCRYHNTMEGLRQCFDADDGNDLENLSPEELKAAKRLINKCIEVAGNWQDWLNHESLNRSKERLP